MRRKIIAIMMMVVMLLSLAGCGGEKTVNDIKKETAEILMEAVAEPTVSAMGGEWTVIGLARSGEDVDPGYYETYYDNVRVSVKSAKGVLSDTHYTEYARVGIAAAVIGEDPTNIEGYDILKPLDDYEGVTGQGVNGAAYALMAAKINDYTLNNEQKYVDYILEQQLAGGGFSYSAKDERASADMTAIAIQALAMYPENKDADEAVDKSINVLAELQDEEGLFADEGFDSSSEAVSQVIIALVSAGIDPVSDERFIKGEKTLFDVLMGFYGDNGFCHVTGDGGNIMATEQAMCALDALVLIQEGNSLYAF